MRAFRRLILTDLMNVRKPVLATIAVFLVAHVTFIATMGTMNKATMLGWYGAINGLSLTASVIIPIILSFSIWSQEWAMNSHYVLFSLPLSKLRIFTSKFIVITLSFIALMSTVGIGYLIDTRLGEQIPRLNRFSLEDWNVAVSLIVSAITMILLCFFCSILSKSLRRMGGVLTGLLFIMLINLPSMITYWLIPKATNVHQVSIMPGLIMINNEAFLLMPIIINLLLGTLYLLSSLYLLNRKVEL